ncbi:RHS repeat-associated core domain-containing protein [Dyella sp. 2RAB6]|uniref:RHS repeat-associated core domain-containing protein n=1 Tax=Dyella sp. 2RAB6 TaxID=3232992 RepID=UPI003F939AFF
MKRWILLLLTGLLFWAPMAGAQNYNAVSTYPQNQVQWDGPAAQAWEESSLAAAWAAYFSAVGSPEKCWLMDWHVEPSGTSYTPPLHTTEMEADAHCVIPPSPDILVYSPYAVYWVYTCDPGYNWGPTEANPNVRGCNAGYFLGKPGNNPADGNCMCSGGEKAVPLPIDLGSGNMSESASDYVSGNGRLRFDRSYNSNPQNAAGNRGWSNAFAARRITSIAAGAKSSVSGGSTAFFSATYSSADGACTSGVAELASRDSAYSGVTATNSGNGQCTLSNGEVLRIYNTNPSLAYSAPITDAVAGITVFRPDGRNYYFTCFNGVCQSSGQSTITLVANSGGYSLTAENGDVESYDPNGRLLKITSRDGYAQTFARADVGNANVISSVTDSYGRQLGFGYDGSARLTQLTLPDETNVQYAYDELGNLASVTYADGKSITYKYESANFPQAMTAWVDEGNANYATWTYDATTGKALSSALNGNVYTNAVSYSGNATTVTDNLGAQRTFNYQDSAGGMRLVSVSGPLCRDCVGQQMAYDSNGFLKSSQSWSGVTTNYTYSSLGLIQQLVEGVGDTAQRSTNITWNTSLRVPLSRTVSDAGSVVKKSTTWVYNGAGQVLARCEIDASVAGSYTCAATGSTPAGVSRWTYSYCNAVDGAQCPVTGLLLSATGPRTDVTSTAHYSYYMSADESGCGTIGGACHRAGDLYQVTDPAGHVTTFVTYDKNGRVMRQRDTNGVLTDTTYHARGWVLTRTVRANADGTASSNDAVTQIGYTPYGAVTSVKDPDGVQLTYTYDAAHRLTDIADPVGNRIHYTLDAAGNKTKEETYDAGNTLRRSLARSYNTLGELTGIKDGLNRTVFDASFSDSYDGNGNLVRSADALGIQRKQGFDALNRLVSTIDNYNGTDTATQNTQSVFAYGPRDELQGVSDPDGLNTTYDYDGLGNAKAVHSPDTGTSSYVFDAAGNRIQATDARGVVSHSTFDALNRITATTYPTSDANVSYRYDEADSVTGCVGSYAVGRLTSVVETAVATVYCYDARGNVVQKRQTQGTNVDMVSYSYTLADRLASTHTPDGTVIQYSRDGAGRISGVNVQSPGSSGAGNVVTNASYLPFGPIASYTLGNGQTITRTYDANYAVTDVVSPALNLHFARDAIGNITALGNASGANPAIETYSYDPLYRLTGLKDAQGQAIEAYTYNKTGDRLSKASNGLATGTYGYQTGTHWLTSIGSSARTYDANGNTTGNAAGGDTFGYGYNDRNRLTVVQRNGQTAANYIYNAMGQRVAKAASASQRFTYDEGSQLLGEYGATSRSYVWLDSLPVAIISTNGSGSTVSYVHADGLNTPRSIADSTGATVWQWAYQANPFGEKLPTTTEITFNLRFPGQYYDVESRLHNNINRDYEAVTGRYGQADPLGFNAGPSLYSYTASNPLSHVDPLGLVPDNKSWRILCFILFAACNQNPDMVQPNNPGAPPGHQTPAEPRGNPLGGMEDPVPAEPEAPPQSCPGGQPQGGTPTGGLS